MTIEIRPLDAPELLQLWRVGFGKHGIRRPDDYYDRCYAENGAGSRVTLLAFADGAFAGCAHLKYESDYPYYAERRIPEINDLNVFPEFRRQGIGDRLLAAFERIAERERGIIGIGVGLYRSYAAAQRLYCRRGYLPDGNGLMYKNLPVEPGTEARVDDDLNLYFVKSLRAQEPPADAGAAVERMRRKTEVAIRGYAPGDAADAALLMGDLGYPATAEQMERRLARLTDLPDAAIFVAELGGRAVGLIGVRLVHYYEEDEAAAHISVLVTKRELQGQGIGRALLRRAEQWAAAKEAALLQLTSGNKPEREAAHAFYKAAGFEMTGSRFVKRLQAGDGDL